MKRSIFRIHPYLEINGKFDGTKKVILTVNEILILCSSVDTQGMNLLRKKLYDFFERNYGKEYKKLKKKKEEEDNKEYIKLSKSYLKKNELKKFVKLNEVQFKDIETRRKINGDIPKLILKKYRDKNIVFVYGEYFNRKTASKKKKPLIEALIALREKKELRIKSNEKKSK
ncbi:MAG TPA: hypothetical protein P5136_06420 [Methanofastidiosum sp.]|nr:hypothetical protein [Methanofastidiosum sp.]